MLIFLLVVICLAPFEAVTTTPRIISIQETLFSLWNAPSNPTSMQEHKAKGTLKKERLFYCDIYDMDPLLTGMAEGNLGILHRCDEGCIGDPLADGAVSWSSQTSMHVRASHRNFLTTWCIHLTSLWS